MVGRGRELGLVREALARAPTRPVCVVGEPGVGKSRLLVEVTAGITASSVPRRVASGRATPVDRRTPYRPLVEALLTASQEAAAPPVVGMLLGHESDAVPGLLPPVVIADAVLTALVANGPTVLVLEDLHWADPDTCAVVEYLADHGPPAGLTLLASSRPPAPAWAHRDAVEVRLERLSPSDTTALAIACLDRRPTDEEQHAIAAADGLPLLVEDLLSSGGATARFDDLVRERLDAVDDEARWVAEVAALLGEQVDLTALAAAAGLATPALDAAVRRLLAADLLVADSGGLGFRHALTRDAVVTSLTVRRPTACASTAAALADAGAPPGKVAELWLGAGRPDRAARCLADGATDATRRGALRTAEDLLRRGLAVAPTGSAIRAALALGLAHTLIASGQAIALLEAARSLAAELVTETDQAELDLLQARAAVVAERIDDARGHLARSRRRSREPRATAAAAVLEAQLALAESAPGRVAAAQHLAAQAIGLARAAGSAELECEAIEAAALCARTHDLDLADRQLRTGLSVAESAGQPTWRLRFLNELGAVELLRDGRGDLLERALGEAEAAGALGVAAGVMCNLASLSVMAGRWAEAEVRLADAGARAQRLGMTPLAGAVAAIEAVMWACRGDRHRMEAAARRAGAESRDDTDAAAMVGLASGVLALVMEDRPSADAALHAWRSAGVARTLDAPTGPARMLAAFAGTIGPADLATARKGLVRGARWDEMWHSAAEAIALGPHDPAAAVEARARVEAAGVPTPVFCTLALRTVAEASLREGWGAPEAWLDDAARTADDLGLARVAVACRALLKRAGVRTASRARAAVAAPLRDRGVTAREAEVLDLVAERMQNREIAERLVLSPRTVEKHVASLLDKCDAGDRTDLVRFAQTLRLDHG